ncbi:MAG TPA: alpha/beta hydrolase, partial [Bacteroidales bacterium]|nr:alpha/beta hydrolase [Bacteroidales bacterium]HPV27395.1 alpha/beta hydrolase [Bacteroidales bacterium]HQO85565.1 alpha/beta hydrolase [Bacteroidales bacterium]
RGRMKRNIQFEGVRIYYTVRGKGRPIVLLHGYLEGGEVWDPLAEKLEEDYRIISPDLPGHGESGVKGEVHTMEFLASAVREVIRDAGEKRVVMVGHSLGGYVTLAYVELYPEMLSGYVLFHSHPHADTPEAIARRKREIAIVRAGKKNIMYPGNVSMMFAKENLKSMHAQLERSRQIASRNSVEGIIAILNGMIVRPSRQYILEKGEVPLLWILGRHDLYFSPGKAQYDIGLPLNARVVILENSGHLGFIEETEKSALLLKDFAGRLTW